MKDEFSELWPSQFRQEIKLKRFKVAKSLDSLKNRDSDYAHAHELMIRIYDATLAAIDEAIVTVRADDAGEAP